MAEIIISDGQYDIVSLSRKVYEEGGSVPESELSPEISANGSNDEILGASSPSVEAAVQWAINTAYDQSHGYSQVNRWGNPDYDCSSFVYYALKNSGYDVGDRVMHQKYGEGTVTALSLEPRDYKVTVDFDEVGTKIMYATFAKLKKI